MAGLKVEALTDWSVARPGLDALAAVNSSAVDLTHEATLAHARLWIAHQGSPKHPLAYALIWLVADEVQLLDLATQPDWRRRGVARSLLNAVACDARANKKAALFLEVRSSNTAALALYESFGFELLRVRRAYYANGEDCLEMRCSI